MFIAGRICRCSTRNKQTPPEIGGSSGLQAPERNCKTSRPLGPEPLIDARFISRGSATPRNLRNSGAPSKLCSGGISLIRREYFCEPNIIRDTRYCANGHATNHLHFGGRSERAWRAWWRSAMPGASWHAPGTSTTRRSRSTKRSRQRHTTRSWLAAANRTAPQRRTDSSATPRATRMAPEFFPPTHTISVQSTAALRSTRPLRRCRRAGPRRSRTR